MKSLWSDTCTLAKRDSWILEHDTTDVVVIGAGMAGILTAYQLQKKGLKVILLEANETASGMTKDTTAKITSQHNLIYHKLIKNVGEEKAKQYAMANENAIYSYKEIIKENNIDCNFEEVPAYVYSCKDADEIEAEVKAAELLGLKASFTTKTKLPFEVKGAIRFQSQAQFHPLKFINGIASSLNIYEHTKVIGVEDNKVKTEHGTIVAEHIVMAAHYPFINKPGYYFMRMHQERSYALALKKAEQLDGMYLSADENGFSFRNFDQFLLLGGANHRSGKNQDGGQYEILRRAAKEFYPNAEEGYHWSAQDCMSLDSIPYIGLFSENISNLYVATGFNKWGMSTSMAASKILADMITKTKNEYADVFAPSRFHLKGSMKNLSEEGVESVKGLVWNNLKIPMADIDQIENGHGGIVHYEGHKVGVYKEEDGTVYMVSTRCTHLGCQLEWNPDEKTWDCPCHGSRFDYKGNLINNPALEDLEHA